MTRKCYHEATHLVLAVHYNLPFEKALSPFLNMETGVLFPGQIKSFSPEVIDAYGFELMIVAGCLGEFYLEWLDKKENIEKQLEILRQINPNRTIVVPSLIDIVISKFNANSYPDDFTWYTRNAPFKIEKYRDDLEKALPIMQQLWDKIEKVASRMKDVKEIPWDESLQLAKIN